MIFDALSAIASTWLPEIQPLVNAATSLYLPVTPHEVLPRQQDLETMSSVSVGFKLPYPITAIEDQASCVVLIDPRPNLMGLDEQRLFIECVPLHADEDQYNDTPMARALCEAGKAGAAPGVYSVSLGQISCPAQRAGAWLATGELLWVVNGTVAEPHATADDFRALPELVVAAMVQASLRNTMTAIEELIAIQQGSLSPRR
jgi:hypothetical protein